MQPTFTPAPPDTSRFLDDLRTTLLRHLPEQVARTTWGREQILAHQSERLRDLLAYAVAHSPFHARRLAGIDIDAVHPQNLSALPVMTKAEMMAELDDVFTDRDLTRADVETALAAADPQPALPLGRYLALASGGGSGQRGVFVADLPAATQFAGSLCRGLAARFAAVGGPPPGGLPIAMVAAGSAVHATGFAATLTAGGPLPFRFLPAPATLPLAEIVERLNALRAPALYGYPSLLARLAEERRAGRLRIDPALVTSTSETCTPDLRSTIREGFGAPLVDTFGSTEGLVGSAAPDEEILTFAEDGCIVELVDSDGRPVPPHTPSARVLITNLYNRVQPLIRYELTDSFTAQPPAPTHGYLRARVHGRADDSFHYGPVVVHPFVVRSALVTCPEIAEYQVRQTVDGIDVLAVTTGPLDTPALHHKLAAALTRAGLSDARIAIDTVSRLDRDTASGKLRRFLPLIHSSPRAR
jgi:phenylacetate-coenzyme A ligase PaaK-like adenylate-forming protein